MSEISEGKARRRKNLIRHRGRAEQIVIYLGKMLRMFVYQSDWKVLPMAALIAGLVSMVIRKDFFLTMEGDLKGSFALVCVAIWNGCFNSIQVICRERQIIKREHRSGMHISAYIVSHMLYQALLCLAQSILTLVVFRQMGVKFPEKGLFTPWLIADLTITVFLMTYASDMLSLWVSALAHNTTTAMTVMPFVLIFQLVFSGGIFNLPTWTQSLSEFTISNYGLKCVAAQADYNNAPMVTAWNTLMKLKDNEIGGSVTLGQVLDFLGDRDNAIINEVRDREIDATTTVGQVWDTLNRMEGFQKVREEEVNLSSTLGEIIGYLQTSEALADLRTQKLFGTVSVGEIFTLIGESLQEAELMDLPVGKVFTVDELLDMLQADKLAADMKDIQVGGKVTVGQIIDFLVGNQDLQARRDQTITVKTTVGRLIELVGEDKVKDLIQNRTAQVSWVADYENNKTNIVGYWIQFAFFAFVYALLAMITLEFIDKDRR